jgi:hypothetical protein
VVFFPFISFHLNQKTVVGFYLHSFGKHVSLRLDDAQALEHLCAKSPLAIGHLLIAWYFEWWEPTAAPFFPLATFFLSLLLIDRPCKHEGFDCFPRRRDGNLCRCLG